jgi:hypothetical protein
VALLTVGSLQPARLGIVTGLHREIHCVAFAGSALLLFTLSRTAAGGNPGSRRPILTSLFPGTPPAPHLPEPSGVA